MLWKGKIKLVFTAEEREDKVGILKLQPFFNYIHFLIIYTIFNYIHAYENMQFILEFTQFVLLLQKVYYIYKQVQFHVNIS